MPLGRHPGYLPNNPAARLRSVGRQGQPAPKGLDDRQVNSLLREASRSRHATRDYALVQVLLQTGMRIGECAALDYEDISFGERSGSVLIRAGKGNKARAVPLNTSARQRRFRSEGRSGIDAGGRGRSLATQAQGRRGQTAVEESEGRQAQLPGNPQGDRWAGGYGFSQAARAGGRQCPHPPAHVRDVLPQGQPGRPRGTHDDPRP